ncbi:G-type lectin S-receptor-like serine/threonine-protein kinase At4g03230 isoform X2 [Prosopis cineraria]|uniref:G-type lectin S-receptor-like serine/threonine-protein kinase At4g03230 isoform X2 n=1 Tax=Prosopis cineraria TaxID=364024 RepID=UPI0024104F4F|nr:G-type lectin S-receptor-like serine/threonine-protein kinase At4g03230 isoform X2 [Prosopis cineraria]
MITVVLLYAFLLWLAPPCLARYVLKIGENLIDSEHSKLVSVGKSFELGFFTLDASSNGKYLGIRYHRLEQHTVVWVANRDNPIPASKAGNFQISQDGNLIVLDTEGTRYWSSRIRPGHASSIANSTVKLMDSGNLILGDDQFQVTYWQSFEHPTDTFLVGMKMDKDLVLTSWKASDDPGSGDFAFAMGKTGNNPYQIYRNQTQVYWASETHPNFGPEVLLSKISFLLTNFTSKNVTFANESRPSILRPSNYVNTRLVMNYTGEISLLKWDELAQGWSLEWHEPDHQCKVFNICGKFRSCNIKNKQFVCKCLPGFFPELAPEENQIQSSVPGEVYKGCIRNKTSCGENTTTFIDLKKVKVRNPDKQVDAANATECQSECLSDCLRCTAYSYNASRSADRSSNACFIWTSVLPTLHKSPDQGLDLSVLVNKQDIESTARTCKPCGTDTIPYPLSTELSCGDPAYFNFNCDLSTGNVNFMVRKDNYTEKDSYRINYIDPVSRTFSIQFGDSSSCAASNLASRLDPSFSVTKQCDGEGEVMISWLPPQEPPCNNSLDCNAWSHSTCNPARYGVGRCLCAKNYRWNGNDLSCKPVSSRIRSKILILAAIFSSLIFLACVVPTYLWRRKVAFKQEKGKIQRTRKSLHDSERYLKDLLDVERLEENDSEGIEVPYLDFDSILLATDNFSDVNKLGRGGYGPVYKGKLPGGQDIAVKRLSSVSSQGLKEFKNEVVLISKLQHRNLVRLRGYCITGEEKILLYEYMSNKSLDTFLFDRTQRMILDWPMRFDIILGVARGILYLHQDSRLKVIHRDLKTSNILLNEDMQPKISDFGLAKIFGSKETEANTERIVGTYGYMAPEYALDGLFSIKSDVFSFGAWRLWTKNNLLDLMDQSLSGSCNANQFVKCAQVSLLCVQDEPGDRPTMSQVLIMLESEIASLPTPKQPTFFMTSARGLSSSTSSSKPEGILPTDSSYQESR